MRWRLVSTQDLTFNRRGSGVDSVSIRCRFKTSRLPDLTPSGRAVFFFKTSRPGKMRSACFVVSIAVSIDPDFVRHSKNRSGRIARSVKDLAIWCCDRIPAWSR